MSYNLNFYPNDVNQSSLNNSFNPYNTLLGLDNNLNPQLIQKNLDNRLNQIQQIQGNYGTNQQQNNQEGLKQPYYLFCGDKNDWDEFLMLNYGMTEKSIFDDYKLFLQAKQEILQEQGQNKIDSMKDKIRNKNNDKGFTNVDSTIQSNVKPVQQQRVNAEPDINRINNNTSMGYSSQSDNGFGEQDKCQSKTVNRKK